MTLNVLWLQAGGCGGCSMSMLCADTVNFPELLRGNDIQMLWHPALSLAGEQDMLDLLQDCLAGRVRLDALCIEGAILRGPHGSGRFHELSGTGVPMMEWVRQLSAVATL